MGLFIHKHGIYELHADTLVVHGGWPTDKRPTEFDFVREKGIPAVIFKRQKTPA
jgi:hypothetical protein